MFGKRRPARRIDAPLPQTGADVVLGESVPSVAPPAEQVRERPEGLALTPALLRSAVTPEASLAATWESPVGLSVDQYVAQISEGSGFADDATVTAHAPKDQPAYTFVNLKTATLYYVRVAAIARGAQSDWSETASETTPADDTAPGPVTSASADFTGPDLLLVWTNPTSDNFRNVRVRIYASNGGALLRTLYSTTGHLTYPYDQNKADAGGSGDPSLYVSIHAVSHGDVLSTEVTLSPTNAAPSTPTVGATVGFTQILATVTSTPPTDFDVYEFVWKDSGGGAVRTAYSKSASDVYQASSSDTYSVEVRARDVFGQYSSAGTATSLTVDALTITDLRSDSSYSDSISTDFSGAPNKTVLKDDATGAGITYAASASAWRWTKITYPLTERFRRISLALGSGSANFYVGISSDDVTYTWYSGSVTSGLILTSVANEAAAQAAAPLFSALTNAYAELPTTVEGRYVKIGHRNTGSSYRLDEAYGQRLVIADVIKVGTLSAITANMGSLTAGAIVIGSSDKLWLNDSSDGAFNMGGSTKASAPFRVTSAGALTATNATITGTVNFGGGEGVLDSTGLNLHAAAASLTLTAARSVVWRQSVPSGTVACYVQGNYDGLNRNILDLVSENASGGPGQIQLYAKGTSTGAQIGMIGDVSGNGTSITATAQDITLTASADVEVVGDFVVSNRVVVNGAASKLGTSLVVCGADGSYSDGPHAEFLTAADAHAQLQILPYTHDNISIAFDAHFDGTNWKSSDAGSNFRIAKGGDLLSLTYKGGVSAGSNITWSDGLTLDTSGIVSIGGGINVGAATGASAGTVAATLSDSATATSPALLTLGHSSSGTPAANFGATALFTAKSATVADRSLAQITARWATPTDASRKAQMLFLVYDTAQRLPLTLEASGTAPMIGFLGAAAVVAQTSGANLTNNVTSGGTDDTVTNWTNLTTYSTDAAAIRNAVYQLARKLKQINDGLRTLGLFT